MSKSPWFKCYAGDFLNGVADLSPNEGYVYTIVMMRIYDEGGPIPDDPVKIARRCNMRLNVCKQALTNLAKEGKLHRADGQLMNDRCAEILSSRTDVNTKASEAAQSRWKNAAQQAGQKTNKNNEGDVRAHTASNADAYADGMPYARAARSQKPESDKETPPSGGAKKPAPEDALDIPESLDRRRGTVLGEDWTLPDGCRQWAKDEFGLSDEQIDHEAATMKDWSMSKREARKDWKAAWRNWIRRDRRPTERRKSFTEIEAEMENAGR